MKDVDTRDLDRYVQTSAAAASGLEERPGTFLGRALLHLQETRPSGLSEGEQIEFVPDPNVQTASSGAVAVHAQQVHRGIPLFQADTTVLFGPDGALQESIGLTVEVGRVDAGPLPVDAARAVSRAVGFLNEPENREPEIDAFGQSTGTLPELAVVPVNVIAAFPDLPARPTVVEPGPFTGRGIALHLVWLPVRGALRLGWLMELHLPEPVRSVVVIVDGVDGAILYATSTTQGIAGRGEVFLQNGAEQRIMVPFPRPLGEYPVQSATALPAGFPDDWLAGPETVGNSVAAVDAQGDEPASGAVVGGSVEFSGTSGDDSPQRVVNIFYYCCLLHDLFYLLGFRETDGNFQADTLSRGGVASDSVVATVFPGTVSATANMTTPKDGAQPRLNVGIVEATGRHTALDATVVFHEYTHGVSSRLVGGPLNTLSLTAAQSAGMSEGWSDFFACSITGEPVIGAWVVDNPNGIRRHRYDADYPGSFGDLGKPEFATKHQIGELWCATLMEFARGAGTPLALQVVVDSFKLAPANPSFLDARDAMLRALDGMRASGKLTAVVHGAAQTALWTAFARFGMGPAASSDGARLDGLVEDFSTPGIPVVTPTRQSATARPGLPIPDKDPFGVTSEVSFDADGVVGAVEVAVDVAHEFRGDLEVTLTSPAGTSVVLRTADPDPGRDLVVVFDAASVPGLLRLVGEPIRGRWRLRVADRARLSLGVFRLWTLTVTLR